jgi:hypothetical protein
MPAFSTFVRSIPPDLLQLYFTKTLPTALPEFSWLGERPDVARRLIAEAAGWSQSWLARIDADAERIWEMTDEIGQNALHICASERELLDTLPGRHARAMHVFLSEQAVFRRAEAMRLADERRYGRIWIGFESERGVEVPRDGPTLEAFRAALKQRLEATKAHVEVYDRSRPVFDADPTPLVQVNVYNEGRPDEEWSFTDDNLDRRMRRPVVEAAITYAPKTGIIEAVSHDPERRFELVRLFASHVLRTKLGEKLKRRRLYNLEPLRSVHRFPFNPEDGIESVRLVLLRLLPLDGPANRVTLEVGQDGPQDIWTAAERWFGLNNPLRRGWRVTQARLAIRFLPGSIGQPPSTLWVTITMPRGCNLKDRTEAERMVGERYLREWQLLNDL